MSIVNYKEYPILFCDDEQLLLMGLEMEYQEIFTVNIANGALAALELLRKQKIAVVISDQRMPEITGIELFKKLKIEYPNVLRILITGFTEMDIIVEAINEAEIFKFVKKPYESYILEDIIKSAIEIYRFNEERDIKLSEKICPECKKKF